MVDCLRCAKTVSSHLILLIGLNIGPIITATQCILFKKRYIYHKNIFYTEQKKYVSQITYRTLLPYI